MTTVNIRRALDELSDLADHPNAPVDLKALLVRAVAEMEAIEHAAAVVDAEAHGHAYSETDRAGAMRLLESIAREKP